MKALLRFKTPEERRDELLQQGKLASQDEVDGIAHRQCHKYEWQLIMARGADGDAEVGELVCTIMRLMDDTDNMSFTYGDESITLLSDKQIEPGLQALIGKYSKDVKAILEQYRNSGIYDVPSPMH